MHLFKLLTIISSIILFMDAPQAAPIPQEAIAYHIYLTQIASMPASKKHNHSCVRMNGHSIFGKSTRDIVRSSDEKRYQSSMSLAKDILQVAEAFGFHDKVQIGYWLGILHKESRFCLNMCGGHKCKKLNHHISQMKSHKPPYADLGIGQINFMTLQNFVSSEMSQYEDEYQKLIDSDFYKKLGIRSFSELKHGLKSLFPSKKKTISKNRSDAKTLFNRMIKNHRLNLSISLPILLGKIKSGINIDNFSDRNSRAQAYQRSKNYKKFSDNFIKNLPKLDRSQLFYWKRAFGVLTYNGHRNHALNYAVDVYCIKSLYDSALRKTKEEALRQTYQLKTSPFYHFYKGSNTPKLPNCNEITTYSTYKKKTIYGKKVSLMSREDFVPEELDLVQEPLQAEQESEDDDLYGYKKFILRYVFIQGDIEELLEKSCSGNYCSAAEELGHKNKLYLYSFVRKVLYPKEVYNLSSEELNYIQQLIQELNPNIKDNIIPKSGIIVYPEII